MAYLGNQPVYQAFVTDSFSGNGSTTAFTMSVAPANTASVLVAVSGVLQDPSTYSVSGLTLTFSAAPPSGTGNISARYLGIPASGVTTTAYRTLTEFTATAGQTTFSVPSYTAGYINVLRNGVQLGTADFTATNGTTVVLTTGATAGDLITTESFYVSSVLNAIPAVAGAVTDSYILSGAVTQSKLGTNVAGNGPAFSASLLTNQSLTSNTWTKAALSSEIFDTNNCYDNVTNYRFTPNVAGYYQLNSHVDCNANAGTMTSAQVAFYKNGGAAAYCNSLYSGYTGQEAILGGAALMYLNGTTDYVELYVRIVGTSPLIGGGLTWTQFSGSLVRAA